MCLDFYHLSWSYLTTKFFHKILVDEKRLQEQNKYVTHIIICKVTGCGSAWQSVAFGTQRPQVRILSSRPRQRKPLYEVFFDIEKNFGAVKKVCRRSNSSSGNSAFVVQAKITLKRLFGAKNIVEFYFQYISLGGRPCIEMNR